MADPQQLKICCEASPAKSAGEAGDQIQVRRVMAHPGHEAKFANQQTKQSQNKEGNTDEEDPFFWAFTP